MKALYLLINFFDGIIIKSLFISVLSIMLAGKVLKTDTRNAFGVTRMLILIYAGLNIILYVTAYFSPSAMAGLLGRTTDLYSFVYYFMIVSNTIFPLILLFKKLGHNKYVLLSLSFLMNIGWLMELLIIYNTDMHINNTATRPSNDYLWFILINGIFIGSVIYAIGGAFKHKLPDIDTPVS
ncbi:hypothetical protein ACFQZX_02970 [Mucilaginibacter litoreus]|uniref:Uncharacterized protein n=1 Tax=Mucilaginibacter litoreus TaxID=1048221 RepID=A0ABW3APZ0_9SPHI